MKAIKSLLFIVIFFSLSACTIYENEIDTDVDLVYSSMINIRANDFVPENEFVTVASYGWNNLDEFMVDEGLVLGYLRLENTTAWHALPFAVPYENDFINLRYSFDIENFRLILEGELPDNNTANAALFDGDVLRVIAIPPSQIVRGKSFDYSNYQQVVEFYGL